MMHGWTHCGMYINFALRKPVPGCWLVDEPHSVEECSRSCPVPVVVLGVSFRGLQNKKCCGCLVFVQLREWGVSAFLAGSQVSSETVPGSARITPLPYVDDSTGVRSWASMDEARQPQVWGHTALLWATAPSGRIQTLGLSLIIEGKQLWGGSWAEFSVWSSMGDFCGVSHAIGSIWIFGIWFFSASMLNQQWSQAERENHLIGCSANQISAQEEKLK